MSGIQKIFVHPACPHCWKVLVAVEFAGITAEVVHVTWEETKKPEFLAVNPTGKVPAVITTEGALFDSHAILRTIARAVPDKNLYGKTNFEKAKVDQWLDTNSSEVVPAVVQLIYPIIGKSSTNVDEKTYQTYVDTAKAKLAPLNEYLNGKKFLVGDSVTIADISLVSFIRSAVAVALDAEFKKEFPHFFTYFTTVSALPEVVKALGRARTCEKRWPLYQAPVAKKEEKKVAEKKETKKKDEEEEEVEAPKKDDSKTELENLPPSRFNFFDFKTLIVNAADKKEAMKTFWEQFDKEGYSLWFVEYEKAEGEGKVVYLTNNLMNGFLQRLEHFRKYAYAVYGVYGDEPNLEVRGVFCWRGTKIPLMIKEHDQYEYHRFTQLHPENENDKKKVEEFWTKLNEDEDVVDGLTARTVKYFK